MAGNSNARRIFSVLDILRKYSDKEHRLSQKDIIELLKDKYGITADRKTVKSIISSLDEMRDEFGFDINYDEANRSKGTSKENTFTYKYYMNSEFDDSQLRLLIDSMLFSPIISSDQCKELIDKLRKMSNIYFNPRTKYVSVIPTRKSNNKELFLTIDAIDRAISENKKISYKKIVYDLEEGFHLKKSVKGTDQVYGISPYQIAMFEGKYYLIGGTVNGVIHIDLTRIKEVKVLDDKAVSFRKMKNEDGRPFNLKEYMNQHVFMCSGKPIRVRLKVLNSILFDVIDTFGEDITIVKKEDNLLTIDVRAPERAIEQFLRRYTPQATIIEPEEMKEKFATLFAIATVATKNGKYSFKKKGDD